MTSGIPAFMAQPYYVFASKPSAREIRMAEMRSDQTC